MRAASHLPVQPRNGSWPLASNCHSSARRDGVCCKSETLGGGPASTGTASGFVDADVLGGRVPVDRGWFHLFVQPGDGADRRMVYRLWITPDSGAPFTVLGVKEVRDDPGFDLWDDTTTLYVQLLTGHVPPPDDGERGQLHPLGDDLIAGAGVLRIKPLDFAKQMTTFRASGDDGAAAIGAFGSLFLGQLWDAYAGLAVKGE